LALVARKFGTQPGKTYLPSSRSSSKSFGRWKEGRKWHSYALADFSRRRILRIRDLMEETLAFARQELPPRVYSKELIEILFRQPYTKGQFLVEAGIAERKTASDYLRELENIGILRSQKVGRENLYLNTKLYELLSQ
jgi:hypothetical protein